MEIKLQTLIGSWRKQGNSRKRSSFASLIVWKPLTVWITINCGKFLKWWEYQITLLYPKKPVCSSRCNRTRRGKTDWSKTGKWIWQGSLLSSAYLNVCGVHYAKCHAAGTTSWNQDSQEKKLQIRTCRWYSKVRKWRGKKIVPLRWKKRVKKLAWNATWKKLRSWHPIGSLHGK